MEAAAEKEGATQDGDDDGSARPRHPVDLTGGVCGGPSVRQPLRAIFLAVAVFRVELVSLCRSSFIVEL